MSIVCFTSVGANNNVKVLYGLFNIQLADVNEEIEAEESDQMSQLQWTDVTTEDDQPAPYIIGDDVRYTTKLSLLVSQIHQG